MIPSTNSVIIVQAVSWFPQKLVIPTATATDIIIATAKDLTSALKKINKNLLLTPSDAITRISLFQLDSIFSNDCSALKSQQSPILKLPRVSTKKPVAALQRVSPSTAKDFHNISPTAQKHCRDIRSSKSKTSPKSTSSFSIT